MLHVRPFPLCLLLTTFAAVLIGCPQAVESISSVDGLSGGSINGTVSISGALSVDGAATAATVNADSIVVGDIDTTLLSAESVTVEDLTANGQMTVQSLIAAEVTMTSLEVQSVTLSGRPLFPLIAGVARRGNTPGAAAADVACSTAFDGSHVCSEFEFDFGIRHFTGSKESLAGASLNVSPRVVGTLVVTIDNVEERRAWNINNCNAWNVLASIQGAVVPEARKASAFNADFDIDAQYLGRGEVQVDGERVSIGYSPECGVVDFVCCL